MWTAVGVGAVLVGVLVAFYSPFAGLLFYWTWFLVRPQEFILGLGGGLPLERILALAMIGSLLVRRKLLQPEPLFPSPVNWALLAFLAVNYLSIATSVWRGGTLQVANDFGKIVILYFCIINLVDSSQRLTKFLWVYALCMGWEAASSIWLYETNPYFAEGIQRATSLTQSGGDPNATALSLALALPAVLVLLGSERSTWKRVVLASLLPVYLVCIVLTASRNGALVTVLAFLLMALWSRRRSVLVPLLLLGLMIGWFAVPAEYQDHYKTLSYLVEDEQSQPLSASEESAKESAEGRIVGWVVSWDIFLDHPVLGVGAGNFPFAFRFLGYNYHGIHGWHQPHNLPGQVLSELGLAGALGFGIFVVKVLQERRATTGVLQALRSPPRLLLTLNGAIAVIVILLFWGGFSGHNLYRYNWYLAGALAVVTGRLAACSAEEEAVAERSVADLDSAIAAGKIPAFPGTAGVTVAGNARKDEERGSVTDQEPVLANLFAEGRR